MGSWYMDPASLVWYDSCYSQKGWVPNGWNCWSWQNAQMDNLLDIALSSTDEAERAKAMRQWQRIFVKDPPQLMFATKYSARIHRDYVTGWKDTALDFFNQYYTLKVAPGHPLEVKIAVPQDQIITRGWNPVYLDGFAWRGVHNALYDWRQQPDGSFAPGNLMVESDEWIDDTTFRVHLVETATWSDGEPFDADDVIFTINSVLNPKIGSVMTGDIGPRVKEAIKIDDYTVDFILFDTYPDIKALLSSYHFALVPEHVLGDVPIEEWKTHISHTGEDTNQLLPGLGIYTFKSWTRDEQWQLELRDPDVPASEGGLKGYCEIPDDAPRTITYVIIPDTTTALAALEKGEIDTIGYGMTEDLLGELPRLEETPGIMITEYEEASYGYVTINNIHPILANRHVRLALWYALDRERIRDEVYFGLPKLQETSLCPVQPYYDPTVKGPEFNLEKAKAELALAGYKEWGLKETVSPMSSLYLPLSGGLIVGIAIGAIGIYGVTRRRTEETEE